ncbi:MAG: hypothetical protein ACJ8AW_11165 [Rhodopila sp.]
MDVIVDDGTMKLNPMTASPKVLATVLLPIVADPGRAARLAGAIVDWRTRNPNSVLGGLKVDQYRASHLPYRSADRPLETLEEIGLVAGMTPDILQRLTPLLTLFRPGRSEAPPPGHDADPEAPAEPARLQMAHIVAVAFLPSGVRFVRSADTRTVPGPMQPPACQNTFVELAVASVAEFGSYSTNSLYLRVTLSSLTDTNH